MASILICNYNFMGNVYCELVILVLYIIKEKIKQSKTTLSLEGIEWFTIIAY